MYQVMIVDDEKYIRKSIINRINWDSFGMTVTAEAGNGREALELLKQTPVDVILADIRMPLMDGLEFLREVRKSHQKLACIIMSAYNDFSYAQNAIHLGVEGYLLKPVEEEELEPLLQKIADNLNENRLAGMMKETEKSPVTLPLPQILAMAFSCETEAKTTTAGPEIKSLINTCGQNTGLPFFTYQICDVCRSGSFVYLINTKQMDRQTASGIAEEVCRHFGKPPSLTAAVSEILEQTEIKQAVTQSLATLKHKMFHPEVSLISNVCCGHSLSAEESDQLRQRLDQLHRNILKEKYRCVETDLNSLIHNMIRNTYSSAAIEHLVEEILILLKRLPDAITNNQDFNILYHKFKSQDYLLSYRYAEDLKKELIWLTGHVLYAASTDKGTDVAAALKNYIQNHYSDNLGLTDIAGKFHLNANYISTLFREQTGMTLCSYIEGVKMEKAKQLLQESSLSITEIALETGYSGSNYFSKVFKKYAGVSPKQYRKENEMGAANYREMLSVQR